MVLDSKMEKLKKVLIPLLKEDEDTKNAIRNLINVKEEKVSGISKEKYQLLQQQNQELVYQKEELESKNKQIAEKNNILLLKIKELTIELDQAKEQKKLIEYESHEQQKKIQMYKNQCEQLNTIYHKYLNLGSDIIKRMERILNASSEASESIEVLMAYGMQENNIIALWDSIACNYDYYDSKGKTDDLIEIFTYFLELYQKVSFKNILIDHPTVGMKYDERYHTRTSASNVAGMIEKVILPGFQIGRNVNKKSLVIVR